MPTRPAPVGVLNYASGPDGVRRRSRLAVAAGLVLAGGVGLSALLLGVHLRYDSDFLCCHHPDVAYATFVGAPLAAMVLAIAAIIDVARHPNRLRGLPLAILVLCLSVIHAVLGIGLISALKA